MSSAGESSLASRAIWTAVCLAFACLLLLTAVAAFYWLPRLFFPFAGEQVLIEWTHPQTRSRVSLVELHSFDLDLMLRVRRDGRHREEYVIDKSSYGLLRFVLYRDRLLALNGDFIFAAYDLRADRVLRYHELPFTVYEGQGSVVAARQRNEKAEMRGDFPVKRESEQTPTTDLGQ